MKRQFALAAWVALFLLGSGAAAARCKTLAFYDLEDGAVPDKWPRAYSAFRAKVPPANLIDPDGNHFIRITASPADNFSVGGYEGRVRSQASVGVFPAREGESINYSFSLRLGDDAPKRAVLWQLFQYGEYNAGYGKPDDGTGPTLWLAGGADGKLSVRKYYNGERNFKDLKLGRVPTDRFVAISISVHWSLDPDKGSVDVLIDGEPAGSMRGVPTLLSPLSKESTEMDIGTYGDGGVGTVDFDDIHVGAGIGDGCHRRAPGE